MGKSITGAGMLPFNTGGFCVDALNYNSTLLYKLNIYKQRSHHTYDLIDTQGNIYEYVNITYKDKSNKDLDPNSSTIHNASIINKNTFFINTNSSFVTSIHNRKIKLSNGEMIYKPWDLYYCNIINDNKEAAPNLSSYIVLDSNALADGSSTVRVKFTIRDSNNDPILNYDTSKIHFYTTPADNPFIFHKFENIGNGEYILPVTSSTPTVRYLIVDIDNIIVYGYNMIVNFM